jgi:hypothetical protein
MQSAEQCTWQPFEELPEIKSGKEFEA